MALQKKLAGGFAALNSGRIADCYSKVILRTVAGMVRGGFCGENRGTLERCAAQGRVPGKGEKGGLCARQSGRCRQSIWVRTADLEEADWQDWSYSVDGGGIWEETLPEWDLKECWHTEGGLGLYDYPASCDGFQRIVPIRNRKELLECVQQLNGAPADPGTLYRLEADLDLGGMTWTPIGLDANTPFEGCFDGGGHLIRNFVLNSRRHPYAGFFGWIGAGGTVQNLALDCVLLGGGSIAAPLCGNNEGTISNCTVSFHGAPSRCTGGLAAQNSGIITHSAAVGTLGRKALIPWWAAALLLLLLCIPAPLYFSLTAQAAAQEVFAPVILDPNAKPIDPETELTPEPGQQTDTSASFIMNAEMYVSTENYVGSAGLRCPSWSSRGFVATVRLTPEDQARLGYDGGDFVTLYQSGLIAPGYGVDVITLAPLPDGSRLPAGTYELSVLLEFYDMETNEKSAVNTEVPLEVTVG